MRVKPHLGLFLRALVAIISTLCPLDLLLTLLNASEIRLNSLFKLLTNSVPENAIIVIWNASSSVRM